MFPNHKEGKRVDGLVEVGEREEDLGKENVGNVLVNVNRVGCSYKEFLACNPKEYDSKGMVPDIKEKDKIKVKPDRARI
nr:hypothetical protein [Tanacetum cinerariifolium]